ncbi:MAG: DoxX family protein [Planctomycetota bacterium]
MSKLRIAGWMLAGLVSAFLVLGSASGKFTEWEGKADMFGHIGWPLDVMMYVGCAEVAFVVLYLVPRTAFLGAVLLTAYLGAAAAAHIRVADAFFFPIVIAVVVWIALGLRDARVFGLAFGPAGSGYQAPQPAAE